MIQKKAKSRIARFLFIVSGSISLLFAILGIFLPLLPTTPLLLLAAYCFGKSSDKIHSWLISNKWFGSYIKNYQSGKGIPVRSKVTAIISMWLLISASAIWGTDILIIRIILFVVATGVTIHLVKMPTFRETKKYEIDLNEE